MLYRNVDVFKQLFSFNDDDNNSNNNSNNENVQKVIETENETEKIVEEMQKTVLMGSASIMRKVLSAMV